MAVMDLVDDSTVGGIEADLAHVAELRAAGSAREAMMALLPVLNAHPTNARARLEMAGVLADLGRPDEALSLYALLARRPDAPAAAWEGLADLLTKGGQDAAAQACLRRAVAIAPGRT
ncbi:MAG TPA: tetratricopeptide repeat protein, partial [Candidatus Omnitrophota bacterium]|nr:tetratricopeptide repeat protein [Candidatus Omnitrophota bacterium]